MQKLFFLLFLVFSFGSCKNDAPKPEQSAPASEIQDISYAKGFSIEQFENYQVISLTNPWPDAKETFRYCLVKKGETAPADENFSAVIETPINSIVVTSTTHIPSLEMLGVEESLVGFPNRNYISSEKTRALIDDDKVKELGKNEAINTEVLIDLAPDVMVTFAIEGVNKTVKTIQNTGIPVLYNSDWTETHPLGKSRVD